jgi:DNA-binding MarR family transcriptional regulator
MRGRPHPGSVGRPEKPKPGSDGTTTWKASRARPPCAAFRETAVGAVADLPGGSRGYQVLVAVDAGPPSSQLALAQRLGIDRTAMTYLIDELEAAGLVVRRPHPADRRVRHVSPTPAGRKAQAAARRALRSVEDQLLGALDPAETAQLRALLVRVARSTDQAGSCVTTPEVTAAPPARRGRR